jgi:hypothetical protein
MEGNLMHTLSELWIFLWQEDHAYSIIARLPRGSTILGAVNTPGRHSHVHSIFVAWIRQNCVQNQPTIAGHPTWPMGMIVQAADQRPRFALVPRLEQGRGFHPTIEFLRLIVSAQANLPNVPQGSAKLRGKPDACLQRIRPNSAEVIAGPQKRTPHHVVCRNPQAVPAASSVIRHCIDALAMKIRPGNVPFCAVARRAKKKRSLIRTYQQEHVSVFHR